MLNDCAAFANFTINPSMLKTLLPVVVAFAVAAVGLVAVRLGLGAERGPRLASGFVGLGVIAALAAVPGFEWSAVGALDRIGHILIGSLIVGVVLDALKPPRAVEGALVTVFALGCGWASAMGGLVPNVTPTVLRVGLALALGLIWLGMILRFGALNAHKPTNLVVLIAAAAGVALLAAIAGDATVTLIALSLAAALFAFAAVNLIWVLDFGHGAVVPAAAGLVAMAWALSQRHPETLLGLGVLALVLFAERTARRVPVPKSGIAPYIYLAILGGCCAIPVVIAAVLVSAGAVV
jgi:hypothetical protein